MRDGGLVAFPTETVYGLGADATQAWAVARIYDAKDRPSFNPLIAHVADLDAARREALLPEAALRLAQAFWPGPLTLVAPAAPGASVCELARAGLPSVAVRVPAHPVAQALIAALGRPIAAPSANRSGHVSPVTAAHVEEDLSGKVDLILDGGARRRDLNRQSSPSAKPAPVLLRPGAIARETIEKVLGEKLAAPAHAEVLAPGMTPSHYAPTARLRLEAHELEEGEAALDFGGRLSARASPAPLCSICRPRAILSKRRPISSLICANSTRAESRMSPSRIFRRADSAKRSTIVSSAQAPQDWIDEAL